MLVGSLATQRRASSTWPTPTMTPPCALLGPGFFSLACVESTMFVFIQELHAQAIFTKLNRLNLQPTMNRSPIQLEIGFEMLYLAHPNSHPYKFAVQEPRRSRPNAARPDRRSQFFCVDLGEFTSFRGSFSCRSHWVWPSVVWGSKLRQGLAMELLQKCRCRRTLVTHTSHWSVERGLRLEVSIPVRCFKSWPSNPEATVEIRLAHTPSFN
jgi:hypothetical protein